MDVRHLPAAAATTVLGELGLAASQPIAAEAATMSAGRLGATVASLLGLTGVIIGGLALARPASRIGIGSGRLGATGALLAGFIGMALGALVVSTSDSGIGTGNGRGGAYVALAVGLVAVLLGALAVLRSRRTV